MDVMDMFKEAQQRILDLNQSRMHALEELAEARAKIIELEERLAQAERDAMANVHMLAEAVVQERGARGGEMELEDIISSWKSIWVKDTNREPLCCSLGGTLGGLLEKCLIVCFF